MRNLATTRGPFLNSVSVGILTILTEAAILEWQNLYLSIAKTIQTLGILEASREIGD